jgi:aldehyde dehydrogenase (NAD+)
VVNLVSGGGSDVGHALVAHPDVKVISFTGSTEVGRQVLRDAADGLKKVHLELGGKNAIIVLDDADLDLALDSVVWSAFGTAGQRCTAASRVILQRGIKDEFTERLVARVEALRLGDGWPPRRRAVINARAVERIHRYTEIARGRGSSPVAGLVWSGALANGTFTPTVFDGVTPEHTVGREEIFGPCTSLLTVDSLDGAIAVNNSVAYGLSSSIFTRDVNAAFRAIRDFDTGLVYVNHGTIGAEIQLPFGGMKATGNGHREAGRAALDVYSEWKSIYVDYSGKLQRAQMDTEGNKAP